MRVVRADLFASPARLADTLVAVGCDPAMGLLADHLARRHPQMELAWQGGSSLAALEAVARGEAHLAGSHLLDPASREYNAPFARRLLGDDVRLVTFAGWEQGLMLAAGDPKGIDGVGDLARPDVRIANREPGSGARPLLDAELRRAGLGPAGVAGYASVVRSHLAAAEAVFSLAELDPEFGAEMVLVAHGRDGQLLGPREGMARAAIDTDKRGGRLVSNVVRIEVRDVDGPRRVR